MPEVFGYCNANCKHPVYTKEQTLSILQQMIDGGSLAGINPDDSPVVALLREEQNGKYISFWLGTEAEFNALEVEAKTMMCRIGTDGKLYLCTDDTTFADYLDYSVKRLTEAADEVITNKITEWEEAKQDQHLTRTITLAAADWVDNSQTVTVEGVTADNTVILAAALSTRIEYAEANIKGTAQAENALTFTCDTAPTADIIIDIVILGV